MKRMKLRVGDPVTVKVMRSVPGRVVKTWARTPPDKNSHEPNMTVETVDGAHVDVCEEDVATADIISAVATLERAEPISIKVEGLLTLEGRGIHIRSRMFIGKPGCTRANVGGEFTMRVPEWLAFTSALKLGAALSDGKVDVEIPHEPQRAENGDPATRPTKCLTCGEQWPECSA